MDLGRLCGVDGCKAGWLAVSTSADVDRLDWKVVQRLNELRIGLSPPAVIAIDIPIGLPELGARQCDIEARRLLGPGRASSVFPAPIRPILSAGSYPAASAIRRAHEAKGVTVQAWGI